jgi:hypothetical protein
VASGGAFGLASSLSKKTASLLAISCFVEVCGILSSRKAYRRFTKVTFSPPTFLLRGSASCPNDSVSSGLRSTLFLFAPLTSSLTSSVYSFRMCSQGHSLSAIYFWHTSRRRFRKLNRRQRSSETKGRPPPDEAYGRRFVITVTSKDNLLMYFPQFVILIFIVYCKTKVSFQSIEKLLCRRFWDQGWLAPATSSSWGIPGHLCTG